VQGEKQRMMEMKPHIEKAEQGHVYDWGSQRGTEYVGILDAFQQAVRDIEELGVVVKDWILAYAISRISAMAEWCTFAGSRMKRKFPGGTTWIAVLPAASLSRLFSIPSNPISSCSNSN
jgi:hypothetical protein